MSPILKFVAKLRHCHWLTWLVSGLTLTALALIVVAGELSQVVFDEDATRWQERCRELWRSTYQSHSLGDSTADAMLLIEHGWPRPYLARALVYKDTAAGTPYRVRSTPLLQIKSRIQSWGGPTHLAVAWSAFDHWPLEADGWTLDVWALLVDILVALAIVGLAAAATQWWIRQHRGRCSLHLRDLLAAVTLVGLLLGMYAYHTHQRRGEGLATSPLPPPGFQVGALPMTAGQSYCGPVWLRKLAGNEFFLPTFHHITSVQILNNDAWRDCYAKLTQYPYLESLLLNSPIPLEALDQLARCRNLKHVALPWFGLRPAPPPQPAMATLTIDNLDRLAGLRLESVSLNGDQVQARHVKQLARLPTIKQIQLGTIAASHDELAEIQREYPTVKIVRPLHEVLP